MSLVENCTWRRVALRALLTEARNRPKPQDVGLPAPGFRRVPGLRQSEGPNLPASRPDGTSILKMAVLIGASRSDLSNVLPMHFA
jgi:hypothetical protein